MAKAKANIVYFCKECGYESGKWMGQCPACKAWNSFVEEPVVSDKKSQAADKIRIPGRGAAPVRISEVSLDDQDRTATGFEELDRVLGSGIVKIGGQVREDVLNSKFNELQTSQIVITDRLHGMLFAAITETPCVVFSNFNHKISESYKWLKELKYISFCNSIDELEDSINKVSSVKEPKYDNKFAQDAIAEILKQEIN